MNKLHYIWLYLGPPLNIIFELNYNYKAEIVRLVKYKSKTQLQAVYMRYTFFFCRRRGGIKGRKGKVESRGVLPGGSAHLKYTF